MKNKETKELLVYSCGYCAKLHRKKEDADLCHMDRTCRTCGKVIEKKSYHLDCDGCRIMLEKEKESEMYKKATKMTYKEYQIKYPGHMIVVDDEYFVDLDQAFDYKEQEQAFIVWGTSKQITIIDHHSIVETFEEETGLEDFNLDDAAIKDLSVLIGLWNHKHSMDSYFKDESIVIIK